MIRRALSGGLPATPIAVALLTILLVGVTPAYAGSLTVAWDSSPDPTVIGYRVYVGTTSGVYTETYDVGNAITFSYNGAEGVRYYFAVAAYAAGPAIGARSSEVSASAGAYGDSASFWSSVWAARAVTSAVRPFGAPAGRALPWTIASVDTPGTSLAVTPDGRMLFVDGGRRVRVITGKGLARESAIVADRSTTLNQVAIDPTFTATGFIWISETQMTADGQRTFTVARYRVVKNRAGERVGIVSGIALPPSGNALFAIGASGHIYVAVPGPAGGSDPYWGTVLRFNRDGSIPQDHRNGSPVIGAGYTSPHAIALEPFSDRVWLSGIDE